MSADKDNSKDNYLDKDPVPKKKLPLRDWAIKHGLEELAADKLCEYVLAQVKVAMATAKELTENTSQEEANSNCSELIFAVGENYDEKMDMTGMYTDGDCCNPTNINLSFGKYNLDLDLFPN